jgi:hypothetical protein
VLEHGWYIASRVVGVNDVDHNGSNIVLEIIELLLWLVDCSDWRFLFDSVNRSKLQKVLSFREDEWMQAYATINRTYHCLGIVLRH